MENVPLVFTDDSLRAIAKKAIARKTGARGLRSILEGVLLDSMYDLPSASDWAEVIVTKDTIERTEEPLKFYKSKSRDNKVVS